jgi:hypothetical protein
MSDGRCPASAIAPSKRAFAAICRSLGESWARSNLRGAFHLRSNGLPSICPARTAGETATRFGEEIDSFALRPLLLPAAVLTSSLVVPVHYFRCTAIFPLN